MKVVIDIDDKVYGLLRYFEESLGFNNKKDNSDDVKTALIRAVINGTQLPKGHGRLIDADELEELFGEKCVGDCGCCMTKRKTDGRGRWYDTCSLIDSSSTIIEADKRSERDIEQEPKFIAKPDGTIEQIKNCDDCLFKKEWEKIGKLISVVLEKQTEQEPKTGHWILHTDASGNSWHTCPACGHIAHTLSHYCPDCSYRWLRIPYCKDIQKEKQWL